MRFERKYRIENLSIGHIIQIIKSHPAGFYKAFPKRNINNIYFDTPNLECLNDNIAGVSCRKKYRVRWYGEVVANITNPKLEIKYKENMLGGKHFLPMEDFSLSDIHKVQEQVNRLVGGAFVLQPILLNSYTRSYWETRCGRFRITIDSMLRFHSMLHSPQFYQYLHEEQAFVVELKYNAEDDAVVDRITHYLPFRLSKNSKYVTGVMLTR